MVHGRRMQEVSGLGTLPGRLLPVSWAETQLVQFEPGQWLRVCRPWVPYKEVLWFVGWACALSCTLIPCQLFLSNATSRRLFFPPWARWLRRQAWTVTPPRQKTNWLLNKQDTHTRPNQQCVYPGHKSAAIYVGIFNTEAVQLDSGSPLCNDNLVVQTDETAIMNGYIRWYNITFISVNIVPSSFAISLLWLFVCLVFLHHLLWIIGVS